MTLQPVLAKALAAAMPGFQRWMQWPVQTADAARGNAEAAEAEAYVASRPILAALAADPETTEAVAAALSAANPARPYGYPERVVALLFGAAEA